MKDLTEMERKTGMNLSIKAPDGDPWVQLRKLTDARIGLGRCGVAQPLQANLDFRLAHAQARDAVHAEFRQKEWVKRITKHHPAVELESAVSDREQYLTRPDLGRKLSELSVRKFSEMVGSQTFDLVLVVGDGLSARAIHEHAIPFIEQWIPFMADAGYRMAPIAVVKHARVAIADEIGALCAAKLSIILIGERPGLSSPDSMGAYLTFHPRTGTTDEKRNCISNIRSGGYPIREAVRKTCYLIEHAMENGFTGVNLKDNMSATYLPFGKLG